MNKDEPKPKIPTVETFDVENMTIRQIMKSLAGLIDSQLPEDWGFSLFLYQLHAEDNATNIFYTSSMTNADAAELIQKWVDRQKQ